MSCGCTCGGCDCRMTPTFFIAGPNYQRVSRTDDYARSLDRPQPLLLVDLTHQERRESLIERLATQAFIGSVLDSSPLERMMSRALRPSDKQRFQKRLDGVLRAKGQGKKRGFHG